MNKALNDIEVVSNHFRDIDGLRSDSRWGEIVATQYSLLCMRNGSNQREKLLNLAGVIKAWIDAVDNKMEPKECENCKKLEKEIYELNRALSRILRIANKEE